MVNAGMLNLSQGNYLGALNYALNDSTTIPYGMFFILLGIGISAMVYEKTRSLSITALIWTLYTLTSVSLLPVAVQPYFALFIGVATTALILNVIKNRK